ncbi:MAG: hypothetical protein N2249_06940 [Melioribacter sp.]|nr:hypothetical protein [Melioribacter sp.]
MKTRLKNILIVSTLFITYCNKTNLIDESSLNYSIGLYKVNSIDEAYNYKAKLSDEISDSVLIKNTVDGYLILYGNYNSSFSAGKKAFELFNKKLLRSNYKIIKNDKVVEDQFANVLFVGNYLGRPSLYSFNLLTKNIKPLWSRWGRKVLSVNRSIDRSNTFIVTALSYKINESFPLIKDVRLYHYNADEDNIEEIFFLGDGIQIYSYWETQDSFKVNFTFSDTLKPQILIQRILSFDKYGKIISQTSRSYDLIKDGFPKPPQKKPSVVSPKGRFQIRNIQENDKGYIYIRDVIKNAELLLTDYKGVFNSAIWTEDEKYVFIITTLNNNYELCIINSENMKVEKKFFNLPNRDLLVHGNFIFFNEQIDGNKNIIIYDYTKNAIYHRIQLIGDCGINSLVN